MRLGQWFGLIAFVISLYILWQIRQVILLLFAAVVFATVLNRIVRRLQRLRIQREIAIALTLLFVLVILSLFFALIVPSLVEQVQQLSNVLPEAISRLQISYNWLQDRIDGKAFENSQILPNIIQNLQTWATRLLSNFYFLISNSVTAVLSFFLFVAATIMLLSNPIAYRKVFILAFPAFYRRRVDSILDECETSLVGWLRGTLIAMLVIAILSYIGLLILKVPLPLVNALLAGLLEFIPNVGPTISVILPTLLALLDTPWKAVAVIILYLLIQQFESLVLVPVLMKQEVSLLPLFTVLSVVVFALLFGFLGLFLAVPLLIILHIWLKEVVVKDILNHWQENSEKTHY